VLQHTPLAVTSAPPSSVTSPPLVAVVWAIFVASSVVTVGIVKSDNVIKVISSP